MTGEFTSRQLSELANVVRMRARLAKEDADLRGVLLLAEFEEELAREYPINDPRWAEITEQARRMVADADRQIAEICEQTGIRAEFRPQIHVAWWDRGENAVKSRRDELRKVATARCKAMVKDAKLAIGREELRARTLLAEQVLTSDQAKGLLEAMPTVEQLLPLLALREIEAATPSSRRQGFS